MSVMQKLLEINDHLVRTLVECEQLRSDQKTLQEICSIRLQRITELQEELRKACAERDELRKDQTKLQRICADGGRRIAELQTELRKAYAERDEAVEHAGRLQAELDATRKQLQNVLFEQEEADDAPTEPKKPKKPVKTSAGQNDLVRDVSHYTEAAEVDRPTTIHPPEYTPPEGWRLLQEDETLQKGDMWVRPGDGRTYPTKRVGSTAVGPLKRLYIRQIEQNPQPEPECKPHTFAAYIVGDKIQPDALRIVWATEEWIEQSKFGIVHRISDLQFSGNDTFTPDQFSVILKVQ